MSLSDQPLLASTNFRPILAGKMLLQRVPKTLNPLPCFDAASETSSDLRSGERGAILPPDNPPSRKGPKLLGTAIKCSPIKHMLRFCDYFSHQTWLEAVYLRQPWRVMIELLRFSLLCALCLLIAIPCTIFALSSDATKVADFKADSISFNQKTGTMVYSGHVDMQQGSTRLMANQVVVYKDEQGNTNKVIATGKPAHYRTLPDGQKNPVDASGDTIEYYPQKKVAIMLGNGVVTQAKNSLKGPHLVYDMANQTVSSIPSQVQNSAQTALTLQPQEDLPGQ